MSPPERLCGFLFLLLAGCAGPLPAADPGQAWIDLTHLEPTDNLLSERLDGQWLDDGRYFQVQPGAHRLEVRFTFKPSGSSWGPYNQQECLLDIRYAGFRAGLHYRINAFTMGFTPHVVLQDDRQQDLAEARLVFCWL